MFKKIIVGLLLAGAAWQDYHHKVISDRYAIGLCILSLAEALPTLSQLGLGTVCLLLSFNPTGRSCWGLGDGLLLGALSLSCSFFYERFAQFIDIFFTYRRYQAIRKTPAFSSCHFYELEPHEFLCNSLI